MAETVEKLCFVIAPIGDPGTPIRKHSDQVFKSIIAPATGAHGYVATRAHEIPEPGTITSEVIQRLLDASLVVADLTTRNPNVFYELAIRHAIRKPLVQLIDIAEPIPFDVATARTIKFTLSDPDSVASAREEVGRHIQAVERDPALVDNPISTAIVFGDLKSSGKTGDAQLAALVEAFDSRRTEIQGLKSVITRLAPRRIPMHGLPSMHGPLFAQPPLDAILGESGTSLSDQLQTLQAIGALMQENERLRKAAEKPKDGTGETGGGL
jgi:hypothetical protein